MNTTTHRTPRTVYPVLGHDLADVSIRGRVYDALYNGAPVQTRILDRDATLAAIVAGDMVCMRSVSRDFHPSRDTRETTSGGVYMDVTTRPALMDAAEVAALFDAADNRA